MFNLMIEQANRHAGFKKSKNWFSIWQENCKKKKFSSKTSEKLSFSNPLKDVVNSIERYKHTYKKVIRNCNVVKMAKKIFPKNKFSRKLY